MMSVKVLRTMRGWTQQELAEHALVNRITISRIECGVPVGRLTQKRVCQALGVSPEEVAEFAGSSRGSHDT